MFPDYDFKWLHNKSVTRAFLSNRHDTCIDSQLLNIRISYRWFPEINEALVMFLNYWFYSLSPSTPMVLFLGKKQTQLKYFQIWLFCRNARFRSSSREQYWRKWIREKSVDTRTGFEATVQEYKNHLGRSKSHHWDLREYLGSHGEENESTKIGAFQPNC